MVRIVVYTGKGGVGKTSIAAASAILCAARGYRTIVLSTDIAHSLADALDVELGPEPSEIAPNLWAQTGEADGQEKAFDLCLSTDRIDDQQGDAGAPATATMPNTTRTARSTAARWSIRPPERRPTIHDQIPAMATTSEPAKSTDPRRSWTAVTRSTWGSGPARWAHVLVEVEDVVGVVARLDHGEPVVGRRTECRPHLVRLGAVDGVDVGPAGR